MSIEAFFDGQPLAVAYRKASPNATNADGMATGTPVSTVTGIQGRLSSPSAQQQAMWASLGFENRIEFITFETNILNGDYLLVDGRYFRVVSGRMKRYGIGGIPSYMKYALEEVSTGSAQVDLGIGPIGS